MSGTAIGVVGGGAWGTALAQVIASGGRPVRLWAREAEVVEAVNAVHENSVFLPGRPLAEAIVATGDLGTLADMAAVLVVTPAQHMLRRARPIARTGPAADPLFEGDRGGQPQAAP
jgi:glycerol-3-phosphate dehydrogenase (NAD(P)+)